jgi:hypothetical protein
MAPEEEAELQHSPDDRNELKTFTEGPKLAAKRVSRIGTPKEET